MGSNKTVENGDSTRGACCFSGCAIISDRQQLVMFRYVSCGLHETRWSKCLVEGR